MDRSSDGLKLASHDALAGVRRFSHDAMATVFEIYLVDGRADYAAQAAQAAFALTDALERDLSRFRPNSDIARIGQLRAGESMQIGATATDCLMLAQYAFEITGGAFDVSLGTGLLSLAVDARSCVVRATRDAVTLDLGGIGKGYAVDAMAARLEEWGITRALIHGGFSSVLALDPPPQADGWPLTLSDPADAQRVLARVSMRQTALGASGIRKGDHIVDPRSLQPARGRRATWVALPRSTHDEEGDAPPHLPVGALSDALTTAFMVMDDAGIDLVCEATPGLEVWMLPQATHDVGLSSCVHIRNGRRQDVEGSGV